MFPALPHLLRIGGSNTGVVFGQEALLLESHYFIRKAKREQQTDDVLMFWPGKPSIFFLIGVKGVRTVFYLEFLKQAIDSCRSCDHFIYRTYDTGNDGVICSQIKQKGVIIQETQSWMNGQDTNSKKRTISEHGEPPVEWYFPYHALTEFTGR